MKSLLLSAALAAACGGAAAAADGSSGRDGAFRHGHFFIPGNLVVSRSVYDNKASNVVIGSILPPNCAATTGGCGAPSGAPNDGTYPTVWNNDIYDPSFGITSRIFLDEMTPFGWVIDTLPVPSDLVRRGSSADHLVNRGTAKVGVQ